MALKKEQSARGRKQQNAQNGEKVSKNGSKNGSRNGSKRGSQVGNRRKTAQRRSSGGKGDAASTRNRPRGTGRDKEAVEQAGKAGSGNANSSTSEAPRRKKAVGAFWAGTISFGLVNVPVQLFPANSRSAVSLRMLDEDGTPLRRRYFCPEHESFVSQDELVRGFEVGPGEYVVVSDAELEAVMPGRSREIDLQRFVDASMIPPLLFERAYFLTPRGDSNKAYRLLTEVMERTGRAGIATFVMRKKEYLVAILAEGGILRAETLRFEDEVRQPDAAGLTGAVEVDREALARFDAAIAAHEAGGLNLDEMKDAEGEALRRLAAEKLANNRDVIEVHYGDEDEPDHEDVDDGEEPEEIDLLETIRMSLRQGSRSQAA